MQSSDPRRGSLCLPAGPEGWRLVLVPLALMLGAVAGRWYFTAFGEAAEAIAVGITAADIAVQIVELALMATVPAVTGTDSTTQPADAGSTARLMALITAAAAGTAIGTAFYTVFAEAAEAVAVGVTLTSVALRVVDMPIRPVPVLVAFCSRALRNKVKELADIVRDFVDRFFGGFGGPAPFAVRGL